MIQNLIQEVQSFLSAAIFSCEGISFRLWQRSPQCAEARAQTDLHNSLESLVTHAADNIWLRRHDEVELILVKPTHKYGYGLPRNKFEWVPILLYKN